jgi:putative membrane protein
MRFLARLLLNGIAILIAAWLLPGLHLAGTTSALLAGVILGLVNALIRPILFVLTLPFTIVTLGLFIFVLNAICLALTAFVLPGFSIDGFWSAVFGALIVSVVSWMLSGVFVPEEESRRRSRRSSRG